ncbi:MAG: 4-alpha-glucanotransferase, partial [Clostridia bacterium]|nr:4-alpha-glucanotransferase [Clostridia bacterium]
MRKSGILLHISSLPSDYGIGTMGREAYKFVDFLKEAKQGYWQILPVGPTSYGDSPYQSFSTFAGNPYFIDLDMLAEEKLLKKDEYKDLDWGGHKNYVDYATIYKTRFKVLKKAYR